MYTFSREPRLSKLKLLLHTQRMYHGDFQTKRRGSILEIMPRKLDKFSGRNNLRHWWRGMTKHQLECIRQPPAVASQPPTVTSETSIGGQIMTNQRPERRLSANQKLDTQHRVISDSDKSKQTHSQSNAECDV